MVWPSTGGICIESCSDHARARNPQLYPTSFRVALGKHSIQSVYSTTPCRWGLGLVYQTRGSGPQDFGLWARRKARCLIKKVEIAMPVLMEK